MGERRAELGWERASGRRRSRRERGGSDRGMQGPCSSGRARVGARRTEEKSEKVNLNSEKKLFQTCQV